MHFDVLVRGGRIVDGTGADSFSGDLGITRDTVAAIGDLSGTTAATVITAEGKTVCPGFIDIHTHSDTTLLAYPEAESRIRQGITTEVVGNCSYSPFPATEITSRFMGPRLAQGVESEAWPWTDIEGYRNALRHSTTAVNVAPLVGHGSLRIAAMGLENRPPDRAELDRMCDLASEAVEQGAFGVSTGLTLAPSSFAQTAELISISKAVAAKGGFYATHSRLWAGYHFKTVEESIEIGRRAELPIQISHQTIVDPRHFGKAEEIIQLMETARGQGIDVRYDVYPYTAGGTPLDQLLPDWSIEGGSAALLARLRDPVTRARIRNEASRGWFRGIQFEWEKIQIVTIRDGEYSSFLGHSLAHVSDTLRVDPLETMLHLIDSQDNEISVVIFNRDENDVQDFIAHPLSMIGSDGSSISPRDKALGTRPHPRFYGTYPRILGIYCRERRLLPIEQAIKKMTGLPAERLGLKDRGRIAKGQKADLVVFDCENISDRATFDDPHQFPEGIDYVFVNGKQVLTPDGRTRHLPGEVLERT